MSIFGRPSPGSNDEGASALVDDPDAAIDQLLAAFGNTELDPYLRDALVQHPRMSSGGLRESFSTMSLDLKDRAMASTTDRVLLERWAASPSAFERAVVAMNPNCPIDLASELIADPHPSVRMNAACNPSLPQSMRAELVTKDPDPDVREFAHWLMTTAAGRDLATGCRYAADRSGKPDSPMRVIAYGITREHRAPV